MEVIELDENSGKIKRTPLGLRSHTFENPPKILEYQIVCSYKI